MPLIQEVIIPDDVPLEMLLMHGDINDAIRNKYFYNFE